MEENTTNTSTPTSTSTDQPKKVGKNELIERINFIYEHGAEEVQEDVLNALQGIVENNTPLYVQNSRRPTGRKDLEVIDTTHKVYTDYLKDYDPSRTIPKEFKMGRQTIFELGKRLNDKTLFTEIEEKESGKYILRGIEYKITQGDFLRFTIAAAQTLYNQSYQSKHTETNTGVKTLPAQNLTKKSVTGKKYFTGMVVTTLNDLCRLGYGTDKPTTDQRRAMQAVVDALHETPVIIDYPNGDSQRVQLSTRCGEYYRASDGAIIYTLLLAPIFCELANNFALLPQDGIKRLKGANDAELRLYLLLMAQNKQNIFRRSFDMLCKEIGLCDVENHRDRTEKNVIKYCNHMTAAGFIASYDIIPKILRGKPRIDSIVFHFPTKQNKLT